MVNDKWRDTLYICRRGSGVYSHCVISAEHICILLRSYRWRVLGIYMEISGNSIPKRGILKVDLEYGSMYGYMYADVGHSTQVATYICMRKETTFYDRIYIANVTYSYIDSYSVWYRLSVSIGSNFAAVSSLPPLV